MTRERTRGSLTRPSGPAARRFGLLVFGLLFVALFIGFAIVQGIGEPSVPAGDVAIVEGVPDDIGAVSKDDFAHELLQTALAAGLKATPKPNEAKYDEIKKKALEELLDAIWIQGEAEEMGIEVTDDEMAAELEQIKQQNFKSQADFKKFLKDSHFTKEDVDKRVKLQILSTKIQKEKSESSSEPSDSEIEDYYEASKATQYTTKPSRDVRVIITKDKAKAEEAKALLSKDDSPANWKKVAGKFSTDPTSKSKGGLQEGLSEETLQEPLKAAVFQNAEGQVIGPIEFQKSFIVIETVKLNPEEVQALGEVRSQIKAQLTQTLAQEAFSEFFAEYQSKWQSRTFCASGFEIEKCANYVGSGHPADAPPACYEKDPKGGLPADCPAPVTQTQPALPGTVTLLEPKGKQLAQRPRPEGLEEKEGAEGPALPEVTGE